MRLKALVGILLGVLCSSAPAYSAQNLFVISIVDSEGIAGDDGTSWSLANSTALKSYATSVANATGLKLTFNEVKGKDFSCAAINKAINDVHPFEKDVVIFYYSGHGFAPQNDPVNTTSIFPWLLCDKTPPSPHYPNLEEVNRALLAKGARMTISVADACNEFIPIPVSPAQSQGLSDAQFKSMFLDYEGSLVIGSSQRGTKAWYRPTGGLFTLKFLELVTNPPRVEPKNIWADIVQKAQQKITFSDGSQPAVSQAAVINNRLMYIGQ
jgi:hypothetical protein